MPHDLVAIIVVILIFGGGTIKRILDLMERRMEARMASQDKNVTDEIGALRQELAQLRDTSTQYDMSIEHRLDEIDRRVISLETHGRPTTPAAPAQEAPQQTIRTS